MNITTKYTPGDSVYFVASTEIQCVTITGIKLEVRKPIKHSETLITTVSYVCTTSGALYDESKLFTTKALAGKYLLERLGLTPKEILGA